MVGQEKIFLEGEKKFLFKVYAKVEILATKKFGFYFLDSVYPMNRTYL